MNILIVSEGFAPDSIIGAVRPTKFAKYLSAFKHEVTVLCSNQITVARDCNSLLGLENVNICRVDDETEKISNHDTRKLYKEKMSGPLYNVLKSIYLFLVWPYKYYNQSKVMFDKMRNYYDKNLKTENYDFVIATFPTLANVYTAQYIHKQYGIKMILDLRDRMTDIRYPFFVNLRNVRIQRKAITVSERTFIVSNYATRKLKTENPQNSDKIFTLYNGYDDRVDGLITNNDKTTFSFAYTGGLYSGKRNLKSLFSVIRNLRRKYGNKFAVEYAGADFNVLKKQAEIYGQEDIIINHGIVNSSEAEKIQLNADVFLVVSWNDKYDQGLLTGKFYEGIKCNKPILAIVTGTLVNSELYELNEKYHYGFCWEEKRENSLAEMQRYIEDLYEYKDKNMSKQSLGEDIKKKFHYKNLTAELEEHLFEILSKEKSK